MSKRGKFPSFSKTSDGRKRTKLSDKLYRYDWVKVTVIHDHPGASFCSRKKCSNQLSSFLCLHESYLNKFSFFSLFYARLKNSVMKTHHISFLRLSDWIKSNNVAMVRLRYNLRLYGSLKHSMKGKDYFFTFTFRTSLTNSIPFCQLNRTLETFTTDFFFLYSFLPVFDTCKIQPRSTQLHYLSMDILCTFYINYPLQLFSFEAIIFIKEFYSFYCSSLQS